MYSIIGCMNLSEKSEYIRTHRGKIEQVKETATQIIDMMSPFVAVKEGDASPLEVVSGEPTPADIHELNLNRGVQLTGDEAYELAAYHGKVLRRQAEMAILGFQASTTPLLSEQSYREGSLIDYTYAKYAMIEAYSVEDYPVQLSYVQLDGLVDAKSTSLHEITVSNGIFIHSLAIASLNAAVRNIKYSVRATEGDVVNRCVSALDEEHVAQVLSLLVSPTTEIEIDTTLRRIWEEHKLSGNTEEITPLLDDIKTRAVLAQRTREMNNSSDLTLPNEAKLNEFAYLLGLKE